MNMKKILKKLDNFITEKLPQDKLLHFTAGGAVQYVILAALTLTNSSIYFPLFSALSVLGAGAVGAIKEALDEKLKGESADMGDIIATTVGGASSLIMTLLTKLIFV